MQNSRNSETGMHQVFMSAKDSLIRMVSRLVPPKEIEDIVQETYVRICQLDNQQSIQQPTSFLMKTARNLAFDHLKKAETRLSEGVADESAYHVNHHSDKDDMFEQAASNEEFSHFCEAVRELPVQCRRVFVLKKVYGYSQKEIARELSLSESTVEKHIAQGFKRCVMYMKRIERSGLGNFQGNRSETTGKQMGGRL